MVVITEMELRALIREEVSALLNKPTEVEPPKQDGNLTIKELCDRWQVTRGTVANYVKRGTIKPKKVGRKLLFPLAAVLHAEETGVTLFKH